MKESNSFFKEEQKILEISRRLKEQNEYDQIKWPLLHYLADWDIPSQLLDLLMELNECPQISPHLRYDLRAPDSPSTLSPSEADDLPAASYDFAAAQAALQEARAELASGEMSASEYRHFENSILQSQAFAPSTSLTSLMNVTHTSLTSVADNLPDDIAAESPGGYLTPSHEEEYLLALDDSLGGSSAGPRPTVSNRSGDRTAERERDAALRNPVSVYNWLRKHQPQVFLQDNEVVSDKSSGRALNSRSSKRASGQVKKEQEAFDEDGILIDVMGSSKGKRKRDEDGGYRPKGGSSRPTKRKKEDLSNSARKGRKSTSSNSVL